MLDGPLSIGSPCAADDLLEGFPYLLWLVNRFAQDHQLRVNLSVRHEWAPKLTRLLWRQFLEFDAMYNLYKLPRKTKNRHPQFFGQWIRKYIYAPLANSNGAILEMLDEKNPVVYASGGRRYKMFQFLTETVGMPALRAHLWQIVGIANATKTKEAFDKGFRKAFPQSGMQYELFDDPSEVE